MGGYFSVNSDVSQQNNKQQNTEVERQKFTESIHKSIIKRLSQDDGDDTVDSAGGTDEVVTRRKKANMYRGERLPSVLNDIEQRVLQIEPADHEYPFENLVFEGGGNKGLAYCGAVRVLEELGMYKNIKRFAGSSAGAMTAALLAVGYNSYDIEEFLGQDLSHFFLDASYGYLSLLPNLIYGYGWNPGKRIYNWFGEVIAKKTGDPDITFSQLYKRTGKELCVVVTNLNHMNEEYCHPKTTPNLPVRLAVRMSMSIPGMFQATQYKERGETNTYVDGGVLCNYPIHCYDGWWLSMKPGDNFIERLQPLDALPSLLDKKNRFGSFNDKTLGFLLYADSERDIFRSVLEKRIGVQLSEEEIDTKLYREKQERKSVQNTATREYGRVKVALDAFLKVLKKNNLDRNDIISRSELEAAFKDEEFTAKHRRLLFGDDVTVNDAFKILDTDGNGEIQYNELINFVEASGIHLQQRFLGYSRKEINSLFSFFDTLQSTLLTNVKRVFVGEQDLERTVGINTGHVDTSDFKLEKLDREFVIEQGRKSTMAFLRYYIAEDITQKLEKA